MAAAPSAVSFFETIRYIWLTTFRPEIAKKEEQQGIQGYWQSITFDFMNESRAYGRYRVSEHFGGIANVVDREEFMRHHFHDVEVRRAFNQQLKEFFHKRAASLGYQYLYLPWMHPDADLYQPATPRFYRFEYDTERKPFRIWRDLNRGGIVEAVIESIPLIYGCKVVLINHHIHEARGDMAESNYELIPEKLAKRIQEDPEYLDYVSALAVSMNQKAQRLISELDEKEYTSNSQPLKIFVRRLRHTEQIVIRWEIDSKMFSNLEGLKLFLVQYQTEVPMRSREFPANSSKRVSGAAQTSGKLDVKLKPGQTAYFGAWVEGRRVVGTKGIFNPQKISEEWWPDHAITFNAYMPERSDSLKSLNEQVKTEEARARKREFQKMGVERPRESITEKEMRHYNQARMARKLKLDRISEDMKEEEIEFAEVDRDIEAGVLRPEQATELKEDIRLAHEAYRDSIRSSMAG